MSTVEVKVQVGKEVYELGQGVAGFVTAVSQALKDGWQIGQDIPVVMSAALTQLVPALQGVEQIPAEYATSHKAVVFGALLPLSDAIEKMVAK